MMNNNQLYNLVLPTSVEPSYGWKANDRVVFKINHQNQQIRPHSVRLNGILQLWRDSLWSQPITATDKFMLNPNAGVNGIIKQIQVKFGSSNVETINEFGRWVAIKNEAKYYQLDHATSTDSMLELMTFSNDAYSGGDDLKINVTQGLKFPVNENQGGTSELPFSLDLDICVNNSVDPIPYSRTGEIEISIIFQDDVKCGFVSRASSQGVYTYTVRNLEIRFLAEPEQPHNGAIILETKTNDHIPTVLTKIAGVEFSPSHAFDSVVCSFLKSTHDSTYNNMEYDYLASEAIDEQIDYMEFKINGQDNVLQYPLTKQTSEILYNYLLAWKPYIHAYDDMEVKKHGLTYSKLGNSLKTGYGVGVHLHGGVDAGAKVGFQISLNTTPTTPYRMFCYAIGKLII
jgi:hypothetical protein